MGGINLGEHQGRIPHDQELLLNLQKAASTLGWPIFDFANRLVVVGLETEALSLLRILTNPRNQDEPSTSKMESPP